MDKLLFMNNYIMAERIKMMKVCAALEPWSVMDQLKAFEEGEEESV